jgi:hypothetical protein
MTENQAYLLNVVVGLVVTLGGLSLLSAIGVEGMMLAVAGLLGLVGTSFMVGVIGVHYEEKEIERGEDPERSLAERMRERG